MQNSAMAAPPGAHGDDVTEAAWRAAEGSRRREGRCRAHAEGRREARERERKWDRSPVVVAPPAPGQLSITPGRGGQRARRDSTGHGPAGRTRCLRDAASATRAAAPGLEKEKRSMLAWPHQVAGC